MTTNRRSLSSAASAIALGLLSATALSAPALAQGANVCANADVIAAIPTTTAFDSSNPSDTPGV